MGRRGLSSFLRRRRFARRGAGAVNTRRLPHRPLVERLVREHLSPISLRVRPESVEELVRRLLELEPSPVPLAESDPPAQLHLLVQRAAQLVRGLERESEERARDFASFDRMHAAALGERERTQLIRDYLRETVRDPRQLAGDLDAVRRDLGQDVIRERLLTTRAELERGAELATDFLGRAAVAYVHAEAPTRARARERLRELVEGAALDAFLTERLERTEHWPGRQRALEALAGLEALGAELGLASSASAAARRAARRVALDPLEHPWVRAAALELLLGVDVDAAVGVFQERVLPPAAEAPRTDAPRTDFLFRALALERCARSLDGSLRLRLLRAATLRREESEHVRLHLARALEAPPEPEALVLLERLAGLDPERAEPSPRVRAQAVRSASRRAARLAGDAIAPTVALLSRVLVPLEDALVLTVGAQEIERLVAALVAAGQAAVAEAHAPQLTAILEAALVDPAVSTRVHAECAAAREALARELDPRRRALTERIERLARELSPGASRTLPWASAPDGPEDPDPTTLGRVLADLTRRDWGLAVDLAPRRITLHRGDRLRRRLWRVLHEIRRPSPAKRQAWRHTVGRISRGRLRAHPAGMDEVTETTVPGERVHVDRLGEWARQLPTVDDVLDLPVWGEDRVRLFSSYGVTTLVPPPARLRRLANRLTIAWRYAELSALRLSALRSSDPEELGSYLRRLARDHGVRVEFRTYGQLDGRATGDLEAPHATGFFLDEGRAVPPAAAAPALAVGLAPEGLSQIFRDWVDLHGYYFLSAHENDQASLAAFAGALAAFLFTRAHLIRRRLDRARTAIPMRIGGWGSRGKSGTERLKAALFHGLGYRVFCKTTGCEAMFIHALPGQKAEEIFLFRPYDKASIWEQYDVLTTAARMHTEVFLWECMALNPRYVELLEHSWMRDEMATITNAYPDHEDIQGPAGADVAEVISRFIPHRATLVTSEDGFLPMFEEVARAKGTACIPVPPVEADLIAEDLLELFPYREHPRNIALVARLAEELGIERDLAIATMAEHVVPDLGVLRAYPTVRWRGRRISFINGMSANERAGFLGNWRRMGFSEADLDGRPERVLATVVNNRADRISRSEVFSRILVNDVAVDRHVLIGTNLKGLLHYVHTALDLYLEEHPIVSGSGANADPQVLRTRLDRQMDHLRIPAPRRSAFDARLAVYAAGAALELDGARRTELDAAVDAALASEGATSLAEVRRELAGPLGVERALGAALAPLESTPAPAEPETLEPAGAADVVEHALALLARLVVRARLGAHLEAAVAAGGAAPAAFQERFERSYRELYEAQLVPLLDPDLKGDAIIDAVARAHPPGTEVQLMGSQNIKGTGLDFVYRWVSVQTVHTALERLASERAAERGAALDELESHGDWGLADLAMARAALAEAPAADMDDEERSRRERLAERLDELAEDKRAALRSGSSSKDAWTWIGAAIEASVDYLDSIGRRRRSRRITEDLVAGRIAHARAALEMRALVARQKGGWAAKALRRRFSRA